LDSFLWKLLEFISGCIKGMTVAEDFHVNNRSKMVSQATPESRLTGGEDDNSLHNEVDELLCQELPERQVILEFEGTRPKPYFSDHNGGENSALGVRAAEDDLNSDVVSEFPMLPSFKT